MVYFIESKNQPFKSDSQQQRTSLKDELKDELLSIPQPEF